MKKKIGIFTIISLALVLVLAGGIYLGIEYRQGIINRLTFDKEEETKDEEPATDDYDSEEEDYYHGIEEDE